MIIFDAKYRPNSSALWNKMHQYKDALVAKGSIFINPTKSSEDYEKYNGELITPFGDLMQLDKSGNYIDRAKNYGFVGGINILGVKSISNEKIDEEINSDVERFKKLFRFILLSIF